MNRRYLILISALCAGFVGALVIIGAYPRFKKIEKRGPAPERVTAVLPGDVSAAIAVIGSTFNNWSDFDRSDRVGSYQNKFPDGSQWSHFFLFRKNDVQHLLFPSDAEILLNRGVDSLVEQYVRIPPQLRTQDVYLYEPSGDYYGESEYFYNGQATRFRCSFLIHLERAEKSSTKVEIFEYQPVIWVGEYFGFSAHALIPTWLHDIRAAEATTIDRKAIITMIQKAKNLQDQDGAR